MRSSSSVQRHGAAPGRGDGRVHDRVAPTLVQGGQDRGRAPLGAGRGAATASPATAVGPSSPTAAPAVAALGGPASAPVPSSAPKDPGAGLGEHETTAILDYKKKHRLDGAGAGIRAPAQALHRLAASR